MAKDALHRILDTLELPGLLQKLVDKVSGSDLVSLLLEVFRRRAASRAPKDVLRQYRSDRFVPPSQIELRDSIEFDFRAFGQLPDGFETVELSPVCPLGTSSVLANVDQNNVLSTIRNSEVCSDATNALALEAAVRRQQQPDSDVRHTKLCTSHRQLRAQVFDGPLSFAHFRVLALCTAGRTAGNFTRELEAVVEHIEYYVSLLDGTDAIRFGKDRVRVELVPYSEAVLNQVRTRVVPSLTNAGTKVDVDDSLSPANDYYTDMRFKMFVREIDSREIMLVDGGFTQWTQKLLSDEKEFLLTSGLGTERVLLFRQSSARNEAR